ncbi:MAG: class I SAM-dependent methyltransferase [bacterium]|nr:class I SAM-dependent methyltransferase [bacterium]
MDTKNIKGWEEIYKELNIVQKEIMPCVEKITDLLLQQDKPDFVLLDNGCGTGRHTMFVAEKLANHHKKARFESLDISNKAIEILNNVIEQAGISKNQDISINTLVHNLDDKLPYRDEYFDGVLSTLVVEHGYMNQIKKWCLDIKRVLKRGGLLAFSVPSTDDPRYLTGEEVEPGTRINTKQKDGYLPHHFFKEKEVEELFSGFEILYKELRGRPSVTADVTAKHLEYVFKKR